ncbi:DinB family protein [Flavivirga spongiicola]|uniref:DinB family protein n=1 Tax=Flavivirga spongiicola TaxID=421621 RepID=A0ABU7XS04_9FLAO|nr:DinB family protein [Flavivirga sp. MEBiC05379]MDO5978545.1 DinB family protein [Flavivirga sp. MEBiC05379]
MMKETVNRLESLIKKGLEYISQPSEFEWSEKLSPEKWSKKEILGHLIDSGINNLQRFTEIQTENKPYRIRPYKQNELVEVNDYQHADLKEMANFWLAINNRICYIINRQTEETLNYKIELDSGERSDLRFLIKDYVNHLEHHLNQII